MRHDQLLARLQQQGVCLGVGFQHVGQAELESGRCRFQGLARLFRGHHVVQVLPHQAAVGCGQGIFDGEGGHGGQDQGAAQCGRRVVEELHNFPVIKGVVQHSGQRGGDGRARGEEKAAIFLLCHANFNRHVLTGR